MRADDQDSSQGATIIPLARPGTGPAGQVSARPPRLLDRVRAGLRARHYSKRTEKAYVGWIRRFILFHSKRHPDEMSSVEVGAYLSNLASEAKVSASTQNQALVALLFLYQQVLGRELEWLGDLVHAKRPKHVPVVLGRQEARDVLARLQGPVWLVCALLYGAGLRLLEALHLRVKDIDLDRREITVRCGKGQKDRRTVLPSALVERLRSHLATIKTQHEADLALGAGAGNQLRHRRTGPRRLSCRQPGHSHSGGACSLRSVAADSPSATPVGEVWGGLGGTGPDRGPAVGNSPASDRICHLHRPTGRGDRRAVLPSDPLLFAPRRHRSPRHRMVRRRCGVLRPWDGQQGGYGLSTFGGVAVSPGFHFGLFQGEPATSVAFVAGPVGHLGASGPVGLSVPTPRRIGRIRVGHDFLAVCP